MDSGAKIIIGVLSTLFIRISTANFSISLENELKGKIVGGLPAKIESFPHAVVLHNAGAICSGVIVNSWSILTAAHCLDANRNKMKMMVEINVQYINQNGAEILEVLSFAVHEDYNKNITFAADIALIFVSTPIKFGDRKQKALLANNEDWKEAKGDVVAIGWGWTKYGGSLSELGLLQTKLYLVSKSECEESHHLTMSEDMFCLYGDGHRDTCKGDSGGGVMWNGIVIGIVSHGDGCAKQHKPSVYISVAYHRRWVERKVSEFLQDYCKKYLEA